jgi:MFS family permease
MDVPQKMKMLEPEKILLISSVLWSFGDGMLGPLLAVFSERVGGDVLSVTWAWAMYLGVTGVGMMFTGKMGDRYGHHIICVIGYGCTALATFGYIFVSNKWELLVAQAAMGAGLALCNPTWYALYDEYSGGGEHDGEVWGLASGGGYIAQAVAILIGGMIVTYGSFTLLFFVMGSILTLSAFYQAKILAYRNAPVVS